MFFLSDLYRLHLPYLIKLASLISKIIFFVDRFPLKNAFRTTERMKAINYKGFKPSTSSRIYSDHFTLNDIKDSPGGSYRFYLTEKSCPLIFPITLDKLHKKKKLTNFYRRIYMFSKC